MSRPDSNPEAAQFPVDPQPVMEVQASVDGESGEQTRAIRYMDDDTFKRSLEEVVVVHDRLLAKLAE